MPGILQKLKATGRLRDLGLFAAFVVVAAVFWFILALNDEGQSDFEVRVQVTGMPDTCTFLSEPPRSIHIAVRERGTHLLRLRLMHEAEIRLNFKEYASGGKFSVSQKALMAHLRALFGQNASLSIVSADSISVPFTSMPGKMVPVRVITDLTPELGKVISGYPRPSLRKVKVYSTRDILDTLSYVSTMPLTRRGVAESFTEKLSLRPMPGVRMEPSQIEVKVTVEPLVNRSQSVKVTPRGVPQGQTIVLFPSQVTLHYLAPMSEKEIPASKFHVFADYDAIRSPADPYMPIRLGAAPSGVQGLRLDTDSVQFTIIHHAP